MKALIKSLLLLIASTSCSLAASSFQYEYSQMNDVNGVPIPIDTGTFIIVLDNDKNQILPGGITYQSNVFQSATAANASALASAFGGVTLAIDANVGGNRIIEIRTFNNISSLGEASGIVSQPDNNLDNVRYGIYWFPQFLPGQTIPAGSAFQVGAVVDGTILTRFRETGFTTPPDNSSGVFSLSLFNVNAIVVPEPSSLLLSSLAFGGLFIRRRSAN